MLEAWEVTAKGGNLAFNFLFLTLFLSFEEFHVQTCTFYAVTTKHRADIHVVNFLL